MLSYDVLFKPTLLYQLLLNCPFQVVGVSEVTSRPKKKRRGKRKTDMSSFKFWGLFGSLYLLGNVILKKLSSALPFPPHIRARSTIKRVCKNFGIPYKLVNDVNNKYYVDELENMGIDVILSFQHQIFKGDLLSVPHIACLNCHPAKLPDYRGVKPIFWAMLDGVEEFGVTVHTMTSEIDKGYIVAQRLFKNRKKDTLLQNYYAAYQVSLLTILDALNNVCSGEDFKKYQVVDNEAPYYKAPNMEDIEKFKSKGCRIL